jgi:hypothetical protein
VTVTVPQEYFFAQIFGFDSGQVVASATAEWTLGVTNPAPLRLEAMKADDCNKGGPGYSGSDCYFTFEGHGSQWGWLDFPEGWPQQGEPNPKTSCPQKGGQNDLDEYIGQMGIEGQSAFVPSLWQIPIYVCAQSGQIDAAQEAIRTWIASQEDPSPIVFFPVVAPEDPPCPADGCFGWITGSDASYPVVRLQGFRLVELWQDKKSAPDECEWEDEKAKGAAFCLRVEAVDPAEGNTVGDVTVRLVG